MIDNDMNTNPLGFLKEDEGNPGASHIRVHVIHKDLQNEKPQKKLGYNVTSNCWICERYVQIYVVFDPSKCDTPVTITERDRTLIHFSFENFEPDVLFKDEQTGLHFSQRMVSRFG